MSQSDWATPISGKEARVRYGDFKVTVNPVLKKMCTLPLLEELLQIEWWYKVRFSRCLFADQIR